MKVVDYQDGYPTAAGTGALTCSLQYGGVQASAVTAAAVTVCWLRGMHTYIVTGTVVSPCTPQLIVCV